MKPFFSIVIPTYNCAEKLKRTLDSVIAQSFQDFEVLVMDDGSTDDSRTVVESFNDSRIHYDWAKNSGGPATPRNRGIEAASADWICFLDADDLWYQNKLETVAKAISENAALDVVCHNELLSVLATGKKTLLRHGPYEADFYRVMLINGNRVSTSATTVRSDFLRKHGLRFNESSDYVIVEDYDMWLRISLYGGAFHFCSDVLGEYVIEDGNISSDLAKLQRNHTTLLRDHVFGLQTFEPDRDRLWRKVNSRLLLASAKNLLASKKVLSSARCVMLAFHSSFSGALGYVFSSFYNLRS